MQGANMNNLLSILAAVEMLADDLHYRSGGEAFYALHVLADVCKKDIGSFIDSLKEKYFMGELKTVPPCDCDTYEAAIALVRETVNGIGGDNRNLSLILRLREMCARAIGQIEELKKIQLLSGTTSILDEISSRMQTNYALLDHCATAE